MNKRLIEDCEILIKILKKYENIEKGNLNDLEIQKDIIINDLLTQLNKEVNK